MAYAFFYAHEYICALNIYLPKNIWEVFPEKNVTTMTYVTKNN